MGGRHALHLYWLSVFCWIRIHGNTASYRHQWQPYISSTIYSAYKYDSVISLVETLHFVRDLAYRGSSACHEAQDIASDHTLSSPCGGISHSRNITSSASLWTVSVNDNFHINVTFSEFQLVHSVQGCSSESVEVTSSQGTEHGPFCGWKLPWTLYVQSNSFTLNFMSLLPSKSSFTLSYAAYDKDKATESTEASQFWSQDRITSHILNIIVPGLRTIMNTTHIKLPTLYQVKLVLYEVNTKCYNTGIHVYDGPSVRSAPLVSQRDHFRMVPYTSTAFHITCTVDTAILDCGDTVVMYESVRTTTEPRVVMVGKAEQGKTLPAPDLCQVANDNLEMCVLSLEAPAEQLFVYLVVSELDFPQPNTAGCHYGGVEIRTRFPKHLYHPTKLNRLDRHDMKGREVVNAPGIDVIWDPEILICYPLYLSDGKQSRFRIPTPPITSRTHIMYVTYFRYKHVGGDTAKSRVELLMRHTPCQGFHFHCGPLNLYGKSVGLFDIYHSGSLKINPPNLGAGGMVTSARFQYGLQQSHYRCISFKVPLYQLSVELPRELCSKPVDMYMLKDITGNQNLVYQEQMDFKYHTLNLLPETPCVTLQQTRPSTDWSPSMVSNNCRVFVVSPRQQFEVVTKVTTYTDVNKHNCRGERTNRKDKLVYDKAYQPRCGVHRVDITIKHKITNEYTTSNLRKVWSQGQVNPGSFALSHLNSVIPLRNATVAMTSHYDASQYLLLAYLSFTFGRTHLLEQKLMGSIYYSNGYRSLYQFTAIGEQGQCEKVCINVTILIQNRGYFFSHYYHQTSMTLTLSVGDTFTYHDLLIMEQRHIIVSPVDQCRMGPQCSLGVDIKPLMPVTYTDTHELYTIVPVDYKEHSLAVKLFYVNRTTDRILQNPQSSYNIPYTLTHFVFIGPRFVSWNEAEGLCQSLGGHLASMTSEEERRQLERLMFGVELSPDKRSWVHFIHCRRHDPLCVTFLGLKPFKVGTTNTTTTTTTTTITPFQTSSN